MKYVLKNQEMRQVDYETIHSIGIPGLVLMERAALASVDVLKKHINTTTRILVVAGAGNNGGDALAMTRMLLEDNYDVDYIVVGEEGHCSKDLLTQWNILKEIGLEAIEEPIYEDYDWIVEGLFGVGLARDVEGIYKDVILSINDTSASVLSIDIPSGISGDSGHVLGCAIRADITVTYGALKRGHLLYPGREYAGETIVSSIGFFDDTMTKYATGITYDIDDLERIPKRKAYSNKGSYGKVLVIAGKCGMAGAAMFSARGAYNMGCGLVKVISDSKNRTILQTSLPEVILGDAEKLEQEIAWCDSIVFGPGLGVSIETKEQLEYILAHGRKPLIIDADGLNTIATYKMQVFYKYGCIITPHLGEAARLLDCSIEDVVQNISKAATTLSQMFHCTVVLKDATTLVVSESEAVYLNQSGNHGMATGGSGDVLSGIIGALTARRISSKKAAKLGVFIHGLAGDEAAKEKGYDSMLATDILDAIHKVLQGGK